MIPVEMGFVICLFVGLPLLSVGVLALYYSVQSMHRPAILRESIYQCDHCSHLYAFSRNRPMDRCPQCGHLNEAVRS